MGVEESQLQMKRMCMVLLPSWKGLPLDEIVISTISGGISNCIVKIEPPANLPTVVLKVFGEKTELLVDREGELKTLIMLNSRGFGAKVSCGINVDTAP